MTEFINTLSQEKTYIYFQGEQNTLEEERKYVNSMIKGIKESRVVYLVAFLEKELIGAAQIEMKDKAQNHIGVFGISIAKLYRNDGVGTLLIQYLFAEAKKHLPQLTICTLGVFADNSVAQRIYSKLGFQEYGRLPKGILHENKFIDEIYMYKKFA
jgi:RimJ/RimL family protein N-acetyltransferase